MREATLASQINLLWIQGIQRFAAALNFFAVARTAINSLTLTNMKFEGCNNLATLSARKHSNDRGGLSQWSVSIWPSGLIDSTRMPFDKRLKLWIEKYS
jgi:hypothetical protein